MYRSSPSKGNEHHPNKLKTVRMYLNFEVQLETIKGSNFNWIKKAHSPDSSLSFTGHNKPSKPQLGTSGGGNCGQSSLVCGPMKICNLS